MQSGFLSHLFLDRKTRDMLSPESRPESGSPWPSAARPSLYFLRCRRLLAYLPRCTIAGSSKLGGAPPRLLGCAPSTVLDSWRLQDTTPASDLRSNPSKQRTGGGFSPETTQFRLTWGLISPTPRRSCLWPAAPSPVSHPSPPRAPSRRGTKLRQLGFYHSVRGQR